MIRPKTLILNHGDIVSLLTMPMAINAVRAVMTAHGKGRVITPNLIHADAPSGEFHIKTGGLLGAIGPGGEGIFGLKANGGFFNNHLLGLPNIIGLITLADAKTGAPLAVLDSVEISRVRTGAATAIAAEKLARSNSEIATVFGSGTQARVQIEALCHVLPLKEIRIIGRDHHKAKQCAEDISKQCGLKASAWTDKQDAMETSDVIVCCTLSKTPLFKAKWVKPGTFIAAVGADSPGKQELPADLLAENTVVADIKSQCIRVGDLQHPITSGLMQAADIHAELGQILNGTRPGRQSDKEITIYDSTGTALQDVAVGQVVYEQALKSGIGTAVQMGM